MKLGGKYEEKKCDIAANVKDKGHQTRPHLRCLTNVYSRITIELDTSPGFLDIDTNGRTDRRMITINTEAKDPAKNAPTRHLA